MWGTFSFLLRILLHGVSWVMILQVAYYWDNLIIRGATIVWSRKMLLFSFILFAYLLCPSFHHFSLSLFFPLTFLIVTTLSVCDSPVWYVRFTATADGTELICSESGKREIVTYFPVRIFTYPLSNICNKSSFYLSPYWEPILEMAASTLCRASCRILQNVVLSQPLCSDCILECPPCSRRGLSLDTFLSPT